MMIPYVKNTICLGYLNDKCLEKISLKKNHPPPKISGERRKNRFLPPRSRASSFRSQNALAILRAKNAVDDNFFYPEIRGDSVIQ